MVSGGHTSGDMITWMQGQLDEQACVRGQLDEHICVHGQLDEQACTDNWINMFSIFFIS